MSPSSPGAQPGLSEQALEPNQASRPASQRGRTLVRSEGSTQPAASGRRRRPFHWCSEHHNHSHPVTTPTLCPAAVAVARGNPARHCRCVRRPPPLLLLLVCAHRTAPPPLLRCCPLCTCGNVCVCAWCTVVAPASGAVPLWPPVRRAPSWQRAEGGAGQPAVQAMTIARYSLVSAGAGGRERDYVPVYSPARPPAG